MTASVDNAEKDRPKRAFCSHTPKWQRFQAKLVPPQEKTAPAASAEKNIYQRQYSHVYSLRLVGLKPRCWQGLTDSSYQKVNRVLELREDVPSTIVGTLVKETNDPDEDPMHDTKCRPSDQLFLEDESGRVALECGDAVHQYCTGVVVGVQGTVNKLGALIVDKMVVPKPVPTPKLTGHMSHSSPAKHTPHLLLVSSLLCGDPEVSSVPREMLMSYLQGHFTEDASKVCRVLLAGGGPSATEQLEGIKELDGFAFGLCKSGIPLDVMPSKDDPTTANWPQRPLHSSLMPHSTNLVSRTPNPYAAGHGERLVVGTDGLNIHDLQKHILGKEKECLEEIDALEKTLEWGHMCPTGPDSVPTVPHVEQDPMILDQTPHIYFSGNASKFASRKSVDGSSTLICVPKFSETGEAVLVNLETLQVELLRFEDNNA